MKNMEKHIIEMKYAVIFCLKAGKGRLTLRWSWSVQWPMILYSAVLLFIWYW